MPTYSFQIRVAPKPRAGKHADVTGFYQRKKGQK